MVVTRTLGFLEDMRKLCSTLSLDEALSRSYANDMVFSFIDPSILTVHMQPAGSSLIHWSFEGAHLRL